MTMDKMASRRLALSRFPALPLHAFEPLARTVQRAGDKPQTAPQKLLGTEQLAPVCFHEPDHSGFGLRG